MPFPVLAAPAENATPVPTSPAPATGRVTGVGDLDGGGRARAGDSIATRFKAITGGEIRKTELISVRAELFPDLMEPFTRAEKRSKDAIWAAFERRRAEILARLDAPENAHRVWQIVFAHRQREYEREALQLHLFRLDRQ
jgi:hypothetical protein